MLHPESVARPDHPIHEFLVQRYSPGDFDATRPVAKEDLRSLFEAARWSASSYNEQPWRYIVATSDNQAEFERALSCLVPSNQKWAQHAPVLGIGVVSLTFARNGKPNEVALHDLGAASASLTMEATSRGIAVHQMAGIIPDKARELYNIPENFVAATGIAIGYPGPKGKSGRTRKPIADFVFAGSWGSPAAL